MKKKVVIIGAGPAGLTAGYYLLKNSKDYEVTILESSNQVGGISKTINYDGNRMDLGGHRFFTKDDKVNEIWQELMKIQGTGSYDDIKLDKKIGYIKDNYNEVLIDNNIKISDEGEYIYNFLLDTMELLPIKNIKSIELGLIYKELFNKYYPDDNIEINNLYVNSINKKYFVLISYNHNYYSYNYNKSTFIKLNRNYLIENFNEKKLGVCDNTSLMNNLEEVI